jgi:uncharacterized damage-inducible protein DinB
MITKALKLQINMCNRALQINLDGFTEEEALRQPEGGGNCVNWVVGHILASREPILQLVKQPRVVSEAFEKRYQRGSQPVTGEAEDTASLAAMKKDLKLSEERIQQGLEVLTAHDLNEPVGLFGSDKTRAEQLAFLQFHEAYHVGQIGTLRRMVGKEGAIK